MRDRIGVLFVCLGNICRSPLAEGVFLHLLKERGLTDRFRVDSAGTSDYHTGEPPDARTVALARERGIVLESRARRIGPADLREFDYVLVMDAENLAAVRRMAARGDATAEVRLLREFDAASSEEDRDVPDPYFGGRDGFQRVQDIVERACRGLLDHIVAERGVD